MKIYSFLEDHPLFGVITSFGSTAIAICEFIEPYTKLIGIVLGVGIGLLTFYIQWKNARKLYNEDKNKSDGKT
jgi:hypothetical protein